MKKINSYIFLRRNESRIEIDENGNSVLDLRYDVRKILKEMFNTNDDDLKLSELENPTEKTEERFKKMLLEKTFGEFQIEGEENIKTIEFEISIVGTAEYLDIIIEDDNEERIIDFMKEINEIIISNSKLLNNYIIITSYDSVSEYYCNKVYPKLNEFERKFRKLLFITYTAQFKKLYFEVTTSEKLREKAKEVIQSEDDDYRLQQYLYSLDFGAFKKLLFDKSWTEYDEKQRNKYLKKYGDLTQLTDLDIKNTMINRNKRNDWERLFCNKGLKENFEKIISRIGKLRNIVAHNKIINEEEYNELNELLDDSIITIEQAIKVTETEDFKRIKMEKVYETFEKVAETLKKYTDGIREKANKLLENIELKNSLNLLGNIAIETINEEEEDENDNNEDDDEKNHTKN